MVKYDTMEDGQLYVSEITDDEVILYSNGCPRCKILEHKLQSKGITYRKETSELKMLELGFTTVPMLCVNEQFLDFGEAVKWANDYE